PNPPNVGGSVDTIQTASASLHYLGFNYGNPDLANAGVRRALSTALDRQSLCSTQLQTFAEPAVLPVNPQPSDTNLGLTMTADTETAVLQLREALQGSGTDGSDDPSGDGSTDGETYYDEETGEYVTVQPDTPEEGA